MSGRVKAYGRAFPIRKADVGKYRMVRSPRGKGYRPNAIGVTAISVVNGRGAYGTRARLRRAGKGSMLGKNARGPRARFVKVRSNGRDRSRSGKRLAAYRSAQRRGLSERSAARSALRHVPFSQVERKHGRKFKGVRQRVRRNFAGDAATYAAWNDTAATPPRKKKTRIPMPKDRRGKRKLRASTKRKKKTATRRTAPKKRFRRIKLTNPKTGRKQKSYMYRTKSGARRKVPAWVTAGAKSAKDFKSSGKYAKARERIAARRRRAAARVESGQDAFTPNAGARKVKKTKRKGRKGTRKAGAKKKTKRAGKRRASAKKGGKRKAKKATGKRKSTKRSRAAKKAAKTRAANKARRSAAARKAAKTRKRGGKRKASASRKATGARRKKSGKGRKSASRRKSGTRRMSKRSRAARKGWARRRRMGRAMGRMGEGMGRLSKNRRRGVRRNRKSVARNGRGAYRQNRRRNRSRSRSMKRNLRKNSHRRRYRRNGFMADIGTIGKLGLIAVGGFFGHKALTGALSKALSGVLPVTDASGAPTALAVWQKPIAGIPVLAIGLFGVSKVKNEKTKMALGAGLFTSFFQSLVASALTAANQPSILSALEGYQNSSAYRLRGMGGLRRRRGMRGLGVARNATSIMPQYAPVGQYRQAAAGTGEYFSSNGMGEYFASNGVQGVGAYEKAGPLALQPANSRMGNLPIDDGIRPDADLEHIMDLAESAAGLGGGGGYRQAAAGMGRFRQAAAGMGEYYSAQAGQDGGFSEYDIPQQSQWTPQGPLWAGSMTADDKYTESELPAGVLQGPGGNGVLSG